MSGYCCFERYTSPNNIKIIGIEGDDTFKLTLLCGSSEYYLKYVFHVFDYIITAGSVFIVYKDTGYSLETDEPMTTLCCAELPNYEFGDNRKYRSIEVSDDTVLNDIILPFSIVINSEKNVYYDLIKFLNGHKRQTRHGDETFFSLPMTIISPTSTEIFNITSIKLYEKNNDPRHYEWLDGMYLTVVIGSKKIDQHFDYNSPYRIKFLDKEYDTTKIACKVLKDTFELEQKLKLV